MISLNSGSLLVFDHTTTVRQAVMSLVLVHRTGSLVLVHRSGPTSLNP